MNNVRTVSDTKRAFYTLHTRPINSIYRRVVEELLVEMHLLRVNEEFRYDSVFALGVVTTFDRFMEGYQPAEDQSSIFVALCKSQDTDPKQYRHDAHKLSEFAQSQSVSALADWIQEAVNSGADELAQTFQAIAQNQRFKYSRLFGVGLFTLLEQSDSSVIKDEERLQAILTQICEALNLPQAKLSKDLELYASNLEKIAQAKQAMDDILQAERKRREQQKAAAQDPTLAPGSPIPTPEDESTT
ncbi:photosystem II biogenesis protein Psp29 [Synechococcales cyanobacterium C]|uniref:Protein Thf1 n=1 Tax=Petrachloros mirabilis ULC683 TaxID=2781853 RepID=A0A8K1ZWW8_9CYAN|nr:photosystem II biogenesis protein Psp29 [Petrachloros mirabilis ULC683]